MANLTPSGVPAPFEALGLTFDDVLLQPNESDVIPSEAATYTWFSRNIRLNVSLSSDGLIKHESQGIPCDFCLNT